ncbi:type II toxin-antitoxin system VapC family toxin [Cellulomonas sp. McL0617]|uniref:type II toxin-antitoxin system VapC family toxin n=1 Tax=Cellulomonas sp. McL0617 TaxID=3415675 RepID=UPI003CF0DBB8
MPSAPVPSPRSGGGDDEAGLLPQPREAADEHGRTPDAETAPDPATAPDAAAVLADPRPALDDEPDAGPVVTGTPRRAPAGGRAPRAPAAPAAAPVPRVYADGSALVQFVAGSTSHDEWLAWAKDHEAELLTTPLGLTELRRLALPTGVEARGVARDVEARVTVVRFSDQTLRAATKVSGVLPPFTALHIGAALSYPGVVAVATYDTQLARVAALHGLRVVSPGMAPFWWEQDD